MKKILFTHSYFLRLDPKQLAAGQPYAPLGTLYAAALMRENGYSVSLFDTMFAKGPTDLESSLDEHNPDVLVIYDDGFNYLTKMCLTNMREAAFKMIGMAKNRNCIVIVSGSDATDQYEKYLDAGADFILLGEAEITLLELIKASAEALPQVPGLVFRQNNLLIKTPKRNILKDLDQLPLPAWDLVDIQPYRKSWMRSKGYFSLNIATTRGCPFKCNWCAKPIYGNRYNSRSPENVVAELLMLKKHFGFSHIWFCDDIFGLKPGWVSRFADLVRENDVKFRFKIQCRADLLLQENYIRDLAKAGCDNIWMGAESGSQNILDAMDKGTTVEQIREAVTLLKKYDIRPSFFIQFGYPGETREDIYKTIDMINSLLPHEIGISVSYPLPGTPFYEKVKAGLTDKTNWEDSNEMALMFRNTYQPAFYKQLYKYVHSSFRRHIAGENIRRFCSAPQKMNKQVLKKALSLFYYWPRTIIEKIKLQKLEKPA